MSEYIQVSNTFLTRNLVLFWMNLVKNYTADVIDRDFFGIVYHQFDRELAIELIEVAFSRQEINEMKNARNRHARLDMDETINSVLQTIWNHEKFRGRARIVLETIGKCILHNLKASKEMTQMERRFGELKRSMKLNDKESAALMLAYILCHTYFDWPCTVNITDKPLFFAMSLNLPFGEVQEIMSPKGRLRKFHLLDRQWNWSSEVYDSYINGTGNDAVDRRFYRIADLSHTLPWEYFGDIAKNDGELLCKIITPGIGKKHILLYGEPGTGKTSFAFALAKRLNFSAYEIKQSENLQSSGEFRITGIRICNECESDPKSLLIIDEADELLRCGVNLSSARIDTRNSTEKGITNTILDESNMPTIWICNSNPNEIDESVRRRFDYSIRFDKLNCVQREFIWRNVIAKLGMSEIVSDLKIHMYSEKYPANAGGIAIVLDNVKQIGATAENVDSLIDRFMQPHCRLLGIKSDESRNKPTKGYSLEGLNIKSKMPLERLVTAAQNYFNADFNLNSEDRPRMNILLWGPPGTGKTEFVKYLCARLGREVLVKSGSNLLDKWVGGTEENIADAFRQAESSHAILFFDEIDGIVQNRANADHNWEVTQVNELLQQMENFDGMMVAATNFSQNLDGAIIRRFTFKLEFDYLDDAGKRFFFERMFKTELSADDAEALNAVENLTPGDFRTVRQSLFYLANQLTNTDRINALREEAKAKKDNHMVEMSSIGFSGRSPAA